MNTQTSCKTVLSRLCAFAIAIVIMITLLPAGTLQVSAETKGDWTADGNYTSGSLTGSGTEADPYLITSAADLAKIAKDTTLAQGGKYFKLTADIDLSDHWWVPTFKFIGTFDGNGKMVSGIRIGTADKRGAYQYAGFMQQVQGTIKNLAIETEMYVKNATSKQLEMGGIAGRLISGSIDNCTVTGVINGVGDHTFAAVGGIAGRANGGSVTNCTNRASVTASVEGVPANAAGVVARVNGAVTIANCVNLGTVHLEKAADAGSVVAGICFNNGQTISVTNCLNAGSVTKDATNASAATIAAIYGGTGTTTCTNAYSWDGSKYVKEGDATKTYADNEDMLEELNANVNVAAWKAWTLSRDGKLIPGTDMLSYTLSGVVTITGDLEVGETLTATFEGNATTVSYQWYRADSAEATPVAIDGATSNTYVLTDADSGKIISCTVTSTDANVTGAKTGVASSVVGDEEAIVIPDITGSGTQADPYKINTAAGLMQFAADYGTPDANRGKYFELATNINISDYVWTTIGEFHGNFDGKGYTISGVKIGTEAAPHTVGGRVGFIGLLGNTGIVKNVVLKVAIYTDAVSTNNSNHLVGGVVAENRGAVLNCGVYGVVDVKMNAAKQINIGGVVGRNNANGAVASVVNCFNAATVTAEQKGATVLYGGGVVGFNQTNVDNSPFKAVVLNCYNTGAVSGKAPDGKDVSLGGVVGQMYRKESLLANCYNTGIVTVTGGKDMSGSIFGNNAKGAAETEATGTVENVYWLEGTAAKGAPNNKTVSNVVSMTAEQMKGADFVKTLNANAQALDDTYADVCTWAKGSGYPKLTTFRGEPHNTGDTTNVVLMTTVLLGSAVCMLAVLVLGKKQKVHN